MDKLTSRVAELYKTYIPGHDLKHTLRVASLAKKIAESENYDADEAIAAGLLHDIGRTDDIAEELHAEAGLNVAREALNSCTDFSDDAVERILDAIAQHSNIASFGKLANILQDADKLDGLGAIGISRAYVSKYQIHDYHQDLLTKDFNVGRKVNSIVAQIRMQMEWFGMMYTESAKKMAKRRFDYMKGFLRELEQDILEAETR